MMQSGGTGPASSMFNGPANRYRASPPFPNGRLRSHGPLFRLPGRHRARFQHG